MLSKGSHSEKKKRIMFIPPGEFLVTHIVTQEQPLWYWKKETATMTSEQRAIRCAVMWRLPQLSKLQMLQVTLWKIRQQSKAEVKLKCWTEQKETTVFPEVITYNTSTSFSHKIHSFSSMVGFCLSITLVNFNRELHWVILHLCGE